MTDLRATVANPDAEAEGLHVLQSRFAAQVVLRDGFAKPLRTVAGFAFGSEHEGPIVTAAVVLMDADTHAVIARHVARVPAQMPNTPEQRSFRELPALLAALAMLPCPPDLAFIDGHGIAHPQRLGAAAHFGVATGLPSIGVARDILVGASRTNLHDMRGAFTPLRDGSTQIGWVLRSKPGCAPLIVSPGHRVALASAPELVMRYVTSHRRPEPLRMAARLASVPQGTASAPS